MSAAWCAALLRGDYPAHWTLTDGVLRDADGIEVSVILGPKPVTIRIPTADAYDAPQPVASPHAAKLPIEGANVPEAFVRAQQQRKEKP